MDNSESKRLKSDEQIANVLNQFELVKVLNENSFGKSIIIQGLKKKNGEDESDQDAVIILEKPHFGQEEVKSLLTADNPTEVYIANDIYKKLSVYPSRPFNNVEVQLIYPATQQHIKKYSSEEFFFLTETYEDYLTKTSTFIKNTQFTLDWVYNILDHKSEKERILYEDSDPETGFILLPDMKWDGKTVNTMSILGIVRRRDLNSLRDLNASYLPLLENLREKATLAIEEKLGVKRNKIRAFLHYQPSFYHLHVHFAHLANQLPGIPERNFSLNQIIENIKLDGEYYKKVAIEYVVKKNDKLYELFKDRFE